MTLISQNILSFNVFNTVKSRRVVRSTIRKTKFFSLESLSKSQNDLVFMIGKMYKNENPISYRLWPHCVKQRKKMDII